MGLSTDLDRAPRVHASMPGTGESTAPINVARNWDFTLPISQIPCKKLYKFFAG